MRLKWLPHTFCTMHNLCASPDFALSHISRISMALALCVRVRNLLLFWKIRIYVTVSALPFMRFHSYSKPFGTLGYKFKCSWSMNSQISIFIQIWCAGMNSNWYFYAMHLWWKMWNDIDWNPSQCIVVRTVYTDKEKPIIITIIMEHSQIPKRITNESRVEFWRDTM